MPDPSSEYVVIPYDPGKHEAFVFSAFLGALRKHDEFRAIPSPVFFKAFHRLLEQVTSQAPGTRWRTVVAHVAGDPDSFAGFAIFAHPIVFWVYVSRPHRRFGLGRLLLEATGCVENGIVRAAMRPRDWTYQTCLAKGIRVVHHSGEVAKLFAGMWWHELPQRVRADADAVHPGAGSWHG